MNGTRLHAAVPGSAIAELGRLAIGLATGSLTRERFRPYATAVVGAVASFGLLHAFATSHAANALNLLPTIGLEDLGSLSWVVQAGVGLPIAGLVATAARLSATTRDRRLARLRVLGLTRGRVRAVAAGEALFLMIVGIVAGAIAFLLTRRLVADAWQTSADFPAVAYLAHLDGWLVTILGILLLVGAIVAIPIPGQASESMPTDRHLSAPWRIAILAAGIIGLTVILVRAQLHLRSRLDILLFPAAALAVTLGVFVVVPVLTRLVAGGMLRVGGSLPSFRIAGRRLQHQPVRSTRVVSATVAALFMLSLLQPFASAFADDPLYRADQRAATSGPQILRVNLADGADQPRAEQILAEQGVSRIEAATQLASDMCDERPDTCTTAYVGTCWGLATSFVVAGCRDDESAWMTEPRPAGQGQGLALRAPDGHDVLTLPTPDSMITVSPRSDALGGGADTVFIPIGTPGVADWLRDQPVQMIIQGPGGIEVADHLERALRTEVPDAYVTSTRAFANYIQTRSITLGLNAVTIAVIVLGLVSFALASIDQVLGRRASMASLLVLGIGPGMLRRTQLWESLVPLALGLPVAIGLGAMTGAGLTVTSTTHATVVPTSLAWSIGLCLAGVVLTSLMLVIFAVPRINADATRRA